MRGSWFVSLLGGGDSHDRLAPLVERARQIVSGSVLYRWFTTEPNAEVIVIDLRETHTVGPFIAMFERIQTLVRPAVRESRTRRAIERLRTAFHTAPIRVVGLLAAAVCVCLFLAGAVTGALSTTQSLGLLTVSLVGLLMARATKSRGDSWPLLRRDENSAHLSSSESASGPDGGRESDRSGSEK
jgi:hypothetical protein